METEYRNTTIPMYGYCKAYYTENSVKTTTQQNMETEYRNTTIPMSGYCKAYYTESIVNTYYTKINIETD